jgi:hypothetical protein
MDTLQIARKSIRDDKTGVGVPTAYNLQTLFQFVSGSLPSTSHRAMADVKATATVFRFPIFWDTRTECIFRLSIWEEQQQDPLPPLPQQMENDSDLDSDSGSSQSGQDGANCELSCRTFHWESQNNLRRLLLYIS